jgi:hypothetical protein
LPGLLTRPWNGWGASAVDYPVPGNALRYLAQQVGQGLALPDASLAVRWRSPVLKSACVGVGAGRGWAPSSLTAAQCSISAAAAGEGRVSR